MPIEIRDEAPQDADLIDALTRDAFADRPYSSKTEHFIVRALRQADALAVSRVAVSEGMVVGHVAASAVRVSDNFVGWFGLGPVSVAPTHQRQGIGSALVRAALASLREQGAAGCVLLGDPGYYARFGFVRNASLCLPGAPAEYFLALAWQLPVPSGDVAFHAAFNAVA